MKIEQFEELAKTRFEYCIQLMCNEKIKSIVGMRINYTISREVLRY